MKHRFLTFCLISIIAIGGLGFVSPQQTWAQCSGGEVAAMRDGECQCVSECGDLCAQNGQIPGENEVCVGSSSLCNTTGVSQTCNDPVDGGSDEDEEDDDNGSEEDNGSTGNSGGGGPLEDGLGDIMNVLPSTMTEGTLGTFVITLINWFLGILGLIFIVIIIYAGFKYMTAQDAQRSSEAVSLITNAVIGVVIIMGAYLITQYVASALT